MLDIYTLGEEILRERSKPVKTFDNALRILVDAMFTTMEEAQGVGLAAPQVGVNQRFFIVDIPDFGRKVFVNPQIIATSVEEECAEEGCLSVPGLWHEVRRPAEITVQAQDEWGEVFTLTADGLLGRAIQHENDHLNGVLFIDRLAAEDKEKMERAWEKRQNRRHSG